jgi:tetratricopeptide (TPR) repeat protein
MGIGCGASRQAATVAACLLLSFLPSLAQNPAAKSSANPSARMLLVEKAQAFEARGRPDLSIQIWQQVLAADPKNVEAIAGLAEDLKLTGSNKSVEAMESARKADATNPDLAAHAKEDKPALKTSAIAQKPEGHASAEEPAKISTPALIQLDTGIALLETETNFYIASGDLLLAADLMPRVQSHYARLRIDPPIAIAIDNASLLFAIGSDRALYPALIHLGDRPGLTLGQRQTLQNIWVNWSMRRAAAVMEDGTPQRSIDILDAASQAFPGRVALHTALAGAYAQAGRTAGALALYKTLPMQEAAAEDFQRAIDTALTAGDNPQAQQWLQPALSRFPHDPDLLSLASRYEQAIGNGPRAAEFYQASLAAMPTTPHAEKLAHMAVYPGMHGPADQDASARRPVTAADLPHLLDPFDVPFAKTSYLPSLTAGLPPSENAASPHPPAAAEPAPQPAFSKAVSAKTPQASAPPKIFPPSASEGQTPTAPVFVPRQ